MNLSEAVVYDIETFPNCFTMNVLGLHHDGEMTFEISEFRDHREKLFQWFAYWEKTKTPMIGYNSVAFDYVVLHQISMNHEISVAEIYEFAMSIIMGGRWSNIVWQNDRFAPQIDLLKVHHFDNHAKSTSLKALQVNMRSATVMESPLPFGINLTREQIDQYLIPYNRHDVTETKKFAHYSMDALKFRAGLMTSLRGDVMNWSDTKIGGQILEQKLGDELCYDRESGTRQPRQTVRERIRLNDIIFPYIKFTHPDFNRVMAWMRTQTLSVDTLTENIKTKGVFTGRHASVGGVKFHFGTGGIHGSVDNKRYVADDEWGIYDIDVAALYPSIAIVNGLYPEHLGKKFVEEYAKLPIERNKHAKGTVQNAAYKLASNGTYGNSNNRFSVFYDPKFTMTITINGQLMLCMLAEWLLTVPTLELVQINTDGITYRCARINQPRAVELQKAWEALTCLKLESAEYGRMWIRDVNSYVAETTDKKLKLKGAFWYPNKFPDDISNSSPPAWHKDFSAVVSTRAAVAHMVDGVDIDRFIHGHRDPFDFMCRAKVDRASRLMIGDKEVQRITRYFISVNGEELRKISPPVKGAREGDWKRKNGISDYEYSTILNSIPPGTWDARIHTKNRSKYIQREVSIEAGYKVTDCSVAAAFDFQSVNYEWYVAKAKKLVID